jgi:hypothetical protein
VRFLWIASALKKARARWADEIEKRQPNDYQDDEGGFNYLSNVLE